MHTQDRRFLRHLGHTVVHMDIPVGFTLTVWSTGMIASIAYGNPSLTHVFLFVLGSLLAYYSCGLAAAIGFGLPLPTPLRNAAPWNVFPLLSTAVALVATRFISEPLIGYPVAAFAATETYVLSLTMTVYISERFHLKLALLAPEEHGRSAGGMSPRSDDP